MTEVVTTETICIQDELPITLITSMDLETFIKGHHIYKNIWTPQLDKLLEVSTEPDNPVHKFTVAVKKNRNIVRHLKKGKTGRFVKTLTLFYFLRSDPYSKCHAKVTWKRCNLGDGDGLQVSCILYISGQVQFMSILQKELVEIKEI